MTSSDRGEYDPNDYELLRIDEKTAASLEKVVGYKPMLVIVQGFEDGQYKYSAAAAPPYKLAVIRDRKKAARLLREARWIAPAFSLVRCSLPPAPPAWWIDPGNGQVWCLA